MKSLIAVFVVSILAPVAYAHDSARELAIGIIKGREASIISIPSEKGAPEDEFVAAQRRAHARLIAFMCSDAVSEEVTISYALPILNGYIAFAAENDSAGTNYKRLTVQKQRLRERLLEIDRQQPKPTP